MYEGGWKDGFFHGQGTYVWPDGTTFEGEWNVGFPQGNGKLTTADGQKWNGQFNNGKGESLIPEIGV